MRNDPNIFDMRHSQGHSELASDLLATREKIEYDARNQIRKELLNPYNRLHSIAEDIDFVQTVHEQYLAFRLVANLRCGAWYCDSRATGGLAAHFKSSDGHYNAWSFNLRRPNLHVLPLIRDAKGFCLVDSTRAGKRLPDSLSKTVPIWCAVVNRAVKLRKMTAPENWDVQLYIPPQSVSKQERSQIESKIDEWAFALSRSSYDLPDLSRPLRPIWITPATTTFPSFDEETPFFPFICISASKMIAEGVDRRRNGYSYVQGAGDDHENWSAGLTPDMFWKNRDKLLGASEILLPFVLAQITTEECSGIGAFFQRLPTPINHVRALLSISALYDLPKRAFSSQNNHLRSESEKAIAYVIVRAHPTSVEEASGSDLDLKAPIYEVIIPKDKKSGERAFKACLPNCLSFIRKHIQQCQQVCVACGTGADLSVGIVLVALQAFFDDHGILHLDRYDNDEVKVDKESLRTRLHWIIASRPEANPSRATLKRINEFFMSPAGTRL